MNDTPDFIARKQFEIVFAKPLIERLRMIDSLFMFNRQLAIDRIKKIQPLIPENELKFELIKAYYGTELSPEFLEGIRQKLLLVSH